VRIGDHLRDASGVPGLCEGLGADWYTVQSGPSMSEPLDTEALIARIDSIKKRLDAGGRPTSLAARLLYYVLACPSGRCNRLRRYTSRLRLLMTDDTYRQSEQWTDDHWRFFCLIAEALEKSADQTHKCLTEEDWAVLSDDKRWDG